MPAKSDALRDSFYTTIASKGMNLYISLHNSAPNASNPSLGELSTAQVSSYARLGPTNVIHNTTTHKLELGTAVSSLPFTSSAQVGWIALWENAGPTPAPVCLYFGPIQGGTRVVSANDNVQFLVGSVLISED